MAQSQILDVILNLGGLLIIISATAPEELASWSAMSFFLIWMAMFMASYLLTGWLVSRRKS